MLKQALAFLKKDFLVESSYKFAFISRAFGVLAGVLAYFFIDRLFGHRMVPHLEEFGISYFSYVLLGMAFFSYIGVGMGSFSIRIRAEQMQGTLEAVLLSPAKVSTILFSLAVWNLLFAALDTALYIGLGVFLFKINFAGINILSTLVIFILSVISFSSLGILSASFIMVFKQGNPLGWIINTLEGLIGGVYFPVTVMPGWLQFLAGFLPITYAVRAIELAVYRGYSLWQLKTEYAFLMVFSIVLLPLSLSAFKYALRKARLQGSLIQY
ncbi:MAG: ABC transporter permease [Candidatus Omnitrophica bacterium]|nr:ABC transporter permease [Candidatus Omnitrophota bacterium]MDD5553970.1 ABC transporter permease [Candidatus Omnitrophota bacterium]